MLYFDDNLVLAMNFGPTVKSEFRSHFFIYRVNV